MQTLLEFIIISSIDLKTSSKSMEEILQSLQSSSVTHKITQAIYDPRMSSLTYRFCHRINQYIPSFSRTARQHLYWTLFILVARTSLVFLAALPLFEKTLQFSASDLLTNYNGYLAYRIIQAILVFFELIIMSLIVIALSSSSRRDTIARLMQILIRYGPFFCQVTLPLSGCLILINFQQNMASFVVSIILNVFRVFFLQNYVIRKDQLYCASQSGNLIMNILMWTGCLLNVSFTNFRFYIIGVFFQCLAFSGWYFYWGYQLHMDQLGQFWVKVQVSLLTSLAYILIESFIGEIDAYSLAITFSFSPLYFMFYHLYSIKNINEAAKIQSSNIKQYDLYLLTLLQNSYFEREKNSLLLGLFNDHERKLCNNGNCYSHLAEMYDPFLLAEVSVGEIGRQKDTTFKYQAKCLYEQALNSEPRSAQLLIDYAQFLFNQFGNPFIISQLFARAQYLSLSIFDRIRMEKIKLYYKFQLESFNKNLYEGKLCLDKVINAQNAYDSIEAKIESYVFEYMGIWRSFKDQEIDLALLKSKIKKGNDLLQEIDNDWKQVREHFKYQKRWFYIFLNYSLFLKNQRLKKSSFDYFDGEKSQRTIFEPIDVHFEVGIKADQLVNQMILFHPETFTIQAVWENKHLVITKCSQHTQQILEYQKKQLEGSPLSLVLPVDLKHDCIFEEWAVKGLSNDDKNYKIRLTKIKTRYQEEKTVYKYYKLFCSISRGVEFVCLIKLNQQSQSDSQLGFQQTTQNYTVKSTKTSKEMKFSGINNLISQASKTNLTIDFTHKEDMDGWNLIQQNNLFLKEDGMVAVEQIKDISHLKNVTRLFNSFLLITIAVLMIITEQNASLLVQYSSQYINFMQTYRLPMVLGNNYFKSFLGVGNKTKIAAQITSLSKQMQKVSQTHEIHLTIFDKTINKPQSFLPYRVNKYNNNLSYDQIELFYLIRSSISSLTRTPIDRNSIQFKLFDSYIKPGYDTLINGTKNSFHQQIQRMFVKITNKEIIVSAIQGALFVIFIIVSISKIKIFFNRLSKITQIIVELNDEDLTLIYHYWGQLFLFFQNLKIKQKCADSSYLECSKRKRKKEFNLITSHLIEEDPPIFLNRRSKRLVVGKEATRFQIKLIAMLILGLTIPIVVVLTGESKIVNLVSNLIVFEKDGFSFLRYFPTATLVGYGCLEKYYSFVYPDEVVYNPTRYADVLASMKMVGDFQYIGEVKDESSDYYQKQRNYFFGNPCVFNPTVLIGVGIDSAKCQSIINSSFSRGLAAYMRVGHNLAESYINGKSNLTVDKLDEFSLSVSVLSGYILDAITTWGTEFNSRVFSFVSLVSSDCTINLCTVLLLHLVLFEGLIFCQMKKEYKIYRIMYNNMMPGYILLKEKVTKQKLIREGIIKD